MQLGSGINLNSTNTLNILIRIQQSNCYSDLSIIDFFSKVHLDYELNYLQTIINTLMFSNNIIIASEAKLKQGSELEPILKDSSRLDLALNKLEKIVPTKKISYIGSQIAELVATNSIISHADFIILINQQNLFNLKQIINLFEKINIFVIRNEGDFKLEKTRSTICDCNNCLLEPILETTNLLKFVKVDNSYYGAGHQYTMLWYSNIEKLILANQGSINQTCCKKSLTTAEHSLIIRPIDGSNCSIKDPYSNYRKLGSPKYIAAPMVGQSELAFRMMVRNLGIQLCYTPMINAELFLNSPAYDQELFTTLPEDRPLAVQFAANDPKILLKAALKVAASCDLIDLNLGCPQPIARRHRYGSWLMEDFNTIYRLVNTLASNLNTPISCKIRIFGSIEQTIELAKVIEQAGCSLLTIHGRLRKSNMNLEPADWLHIKAVKKHLNIPVIANGSIENLQAAQKCLAITGCDGVMAASHLLANPYLFTGKVIDPINLALEYLDYAKVYQPPLNYAITHVLQILQKYCTVNQLNLIKHTSSINDLTILISQFKGIELSNNVNRSPGAIDLVAVGNSEVLF